MPTTKPDDWIEVTLKVQGIFPGLVRFEAPSLGPLPLYVDRLTLPPELDRVIHRLNQVDVIIDPYAVTPAELVASMRDWRWVPPAESVPSS